MLQSQHQQMVDFVIRGDSEGARRVVNEHLELIRDTFIENGLINRPDDAG
jgi:DNA-binding FadR family transcriptional regulator